MTPSAIQRWHAIVKTKDVGALEAILADDVVFESPVVHTPQRGKAITFQYLASALRVLNNDSFTYLHEWYGEKSAVLEFQSVCEGVTINGVDIIEWGEDSRIVNFKVMVRPLKAVNKLHELMGRMLQELALKRDGAAPLR
jgi:SnoaL-like domain